MRYFYCSECHRYERVSDDVGDMSHFHTVAWQGAFGVVNRYTLKSVNSPKPGWVPALNIEEFQASVKDSKALEQALEKLEFSKDKSYLVLFDPMSIDPKVLEDLPPIADDIDLTFIPCKFSVTNDGFVSETIILESLEFIEEWVKERKAKLKCTT